MNTDSDDTNGIHFKDGNKLNYDFDNLTKKEVKKVEPKKVKKTKKEIQEDSNERFREFIESVPKDFYIYLKNYFMNEKLKYLPNNISDIFSFLLLENEQLRETCRLS